MSRLSSPHQRARQLTVPIFNGNIFAHHSTKNLTVRAYDGHIYRSFVYEGSLSVKTENGPINVDITSAHLASSTVNDISVQSANRTLNADIFLHSTIPNPTHTLTTATTLGPLCAKIHDVPSDASLTISGIVSCA
ncbi:hypothetical protein DFP72DRAFT_1082045 [Ephemerocybe angulata]|uniref:Adhesin domain-containing protein n=1 Tax=Ephemerocybe angulata TaxID=980116 RepID=A0A8H6LU78_9AGAR|nr:hypothetical protein DFP72DRAFT_1082045 [Tulosesus angulatus]